MLVLMRGNSCWHPIWHRHGVEPSEIQRKWGEVEQSEIQRKWGEVEQSEIQRKWGEVLDLEFQ